QTFQLQQQQQQVAMEDPTALAGAHGTPMINPIKQHRRKMLARYACGVAGVGFILAGALYGFLPPAAFPHEDGN
ncbi:hypothetical protein SYNPS1DRAFT_24983, partial [Syncephalis pseudoplumigaleata]